MDIRRVSFVCLIFLLFTPQALSSSYVVCDAQEKGAVGDGKTDNTKLLRSLFLECDEVVIPSGGHFLTHPLNSTRDNFVLTIEGTLLLSDDPTDWPIMPHLPSYPEDRDLSSCCRYQPGILVWKSTNVTVRGEGTFNGQGRTWWHAFNHRELRYGRPRLFETMYSSQIRMYDVNMRNPPFWTIHLYASEKIEILRVDIHAEDGPNTDGFDPDSSQYVHIKDCVVHNGDDCVAIKSGMDKPGVVFNRPSSHLLFENLVCEGGLSVGSELSGGVSDVLFSNCSASHLEVKTGSGRGGYAKDITFLNIDLVGLKPSRPMIVTALKFRHHGEPASVPTVLNNIRYEGIKGTGVWAGDFECSDEIPCSHFAFANVDLQATKGITCGAGGNLTTDLVFNVNPPLCGDV